MSKKSYPPSFNVHRFYGSGAKFGAPRLGKMITTNMAKTPAVPIMPFADGSDSLANNKVSVVGFQHMPSKDSVYFKAFISQFSDDYNSQWESKNVYGRPDPIHQFKSTTRGITLGFYVPAATVGEAAENLRKVQRLITYLYPSYQPILPPQTGELQLNDEARFNALGMVSPPLVRLKFMNMISATHAGAYGVPTTVKVAPPNPHRTDQPSLSFDATSFDDGVVGAITNVAVNHNVETDAGVFHGIGAILPKVMEVIISFSPLHETEIAKLGWNMTAVGLGTNLSPTMDQFGKFIMDEFSSFPYSIGEEFSPRESVGADAIESAQRLATRIETMQVDGEREAAIQIAESRHSGFLGGLLKMTDRNYYNNHQEGAYDPYRQAAGMIADQQIADAQRVKATNQLKMDQARQQQDRERGITSRTWYAPFGVREYPSRKK